ncbi:hypothetical protein MCEREM21A_02344 [Sphingomonadaceae bacterium]
MRCDPTRKSAGGHFLRGWRLCAIFETADAGHCFNPACAQQSRQTLISAGGKLAGMSTGHGPPLGGISDRREGGTGPISVRGLLLRVKGKNFDNSYTILLASCFGANRGFASSLAKKSGETFIDTNGFLMYPSTAKGCKSDGRKVGIYVDLDVKLGGEKGRFTVFGSNGSIKGSYTSATYNPKTEQITFKNYPKIGSLISQKTTVCSDEKKCGK